MSNYSKWTSCILLFLVLILCMDFVCAFDDSIFVGNSAVLRGGAIGFLVGHDNTVLECTFIQSW